MKEIVIALKDSIESRVKNKVIASFLIAWLLLNWKGVSIFILSEKKDMVSIIQGYKFTFLDDLVLPLFCGIMYITVIQLLIYGVAYFAEIVENFISSMSAKNAKKKLALQRLMNNTAILADYEYQKEVRRERLNNTHQKNIQLDGQFRDISEKLKKATDDFDELQEKYSELYSKSIKNTEKIIKAKALIKNMVHHISSTIGLKETDLVRAKKLESVSEIITKIEELLPESHEMPTVDTSHIIGNSNIDMITRNLADSLLSDNQSL